MSKDRVELMRAFKEKLVNEISTLYFQVAKDISMSDLRYIFNNWIRTEEGRKKIRASLCSNLKKPNFKAYKDKLDNLLKWLDLYEFRLKNKI